jgi:hypothetical protein
VGRGQLILGEAKRLSIKSSRWTQYRHLSALYTESGSILEFTRQYKPIGFGDQPDPGTVEGHLNAMEEAAETRRYNKRMKELETQDEAKRRGLLSRIMRLFFNRTAVPAP